MIRKLPDDFSKWIKYTDANQKEYFMYIYLYENPYKGESKITIVSKNLLPKEQASFKYGILRRLKKGKEEYCGGSNTLADAIKKADVIRKRIGEID